MTEEIPFCDERTAERRCRPLVILGAGGFARQVPSLIHAINAASDEFRIIGFLDPHARSDIHGIPVLGDDSTLAVIDAAYTIGIGDPHARDRLDSYATRLSRHTTALDHPQATVDLDVGLSAGCMILAGARVQAGSVLGRHVLVNSNAVVGHDCRIGDHASLSPLSMLGGRVTLGTRVLVGAGAVVLPGRHVADDVVVGAGAVVTKDLARGVIAAGVPARFWQRQR